MVAQEEIHNQCFKKDPGERIKALEKLNDNFSSLPNKQQAWEDLHRLNTDRNRNVRYRATETLYYTFSHLPDQQQAWEDLHRLITDNNNEVRYGATKALYYTFSHLPDQQQAWEDLHKLTTDKYSWVRYWAAVILGSEFSHLPDKQQAWNDLIKLVNDEESYVRFEAIDYLGSVFPQVPNIQQAWDDLIKLITEKGNDVRYRVSYVLGSTFSYVPDKRQAWNDLIRLINDRDRFIRSRAAYALTFASSYVSDKQQVWNDLVKLANDADNYVRLKAASALASVLPCMLDKQQAWNNLLKLTTDENSDVRSAAVYALGSAFSHVPDKQQAWDSLIKLTNDKDNNVRSRTVSALGSAFSHVPDKQHAWNELIKLADDKDNDVRAYANNSLGKVSIFTASQAEKEEDYEKELEKAILFFEKATQESTYGLFNPSQFCLPFYRSFRTIVFNKQEANEEVDKYMAEAKEAILGSKSKELLFEAVENLANALKEVQKLDGMDLEAKKSELNFYRKYCEQAAELMKNTEETAPYATAAMKKGLPILDRNLKELLKEIQERAKSAYRQSKGNDTEYIACSVCREVQKWEISSQEEMTFNVSKVVMVLKSKIPHTLDNKEILDMIESMKYERDLTRQYSILPIIIGLIPTVNVIPEETVKENYEDLKKDIIIKIDEKFEEMTVSLKPGPRAELVISMGLKALGSGTQGVITIPLKEIDYPEVNIDLEKIKKEGTKLSEFSQRFVDKIKGYLP